MFPLNIIKQAKLCFPQTYFSFSANKKFLQEIMRQKYYSHKHMHNYYILCKETYYTYLLYIMFKKTEIQIILKNNLMIPGNKTMFDEFSVCEKHN